MCFDISSKYTWVIPLKDKKCITITNSLQKILDESGHKPNKKMLNKACEFYNGSIKSWLEEKGMERYSTHNERKSVLLKFC